MHHHVEELRHVGLERRRRPCGPADAAAGSPPGRRRPGPAWPPSLDPGPGDDEQVRAQRAGGEGHEEVVGVGVEGRHQHPGPLDARLQHARRRWRRPAPRWSKPRPARPGRGRSRSRRRPGRRPTGTGRGCGPPGRSRTRSRGPAMRSIWRSMRLLPSSSWIWPSTTASRMRVKVYRAVATPTRIRTMVKMRPPVGEGVHLPEPDGGDGGDGLVDGVEEREAEGDVAHRPGHENADQGGQPESEPVPCLHGIRMPQSRSRRMHGRPGVHADPDRGRQGRQGGVRGPRDRRRRRAPTT